MTGSGYKVDGYGGAYEEERDPLGAIMGTDDPMLYFDEPTYLDMLTEGQPLYLEANPWDPNDGCELDGVAWDCSDIVRQAEYGTVVGGIVVGGQLLKGQVSLQHALNFTGGGWLSIFIPGQDVEFGYDDPDPFKSHTFTLPDQWETLYIHRGGPNANFDPRCPPGMICPESASEMTIGEAIKEGKVQGSWQWSKEERQKVIDCLTPITDEYISQVQNLNASASKGWNFNVSQYVASTLGLPASIDVFRGALREPGASVIYGWRKITINGARINPLSIPGGRRAFWINFTFASAVFLYTQLDANEKDGKTFALLTDSYWLKRNDCIKSVPADVFVLAPTPPGTVPRN